MGWNLELRVLGLQPTAAAMEIHPRALWLRGAPTCSWRLGAVGPPSGELACTPSCLPGLARCLFPAGM